MKRLSVAVMLLAIAGAVQASVAAESPAIDVPAIDVMSKLFSAQMNLAKGGDVKAWYHVGEMYEKGLGVAQDLNEARSWYAKAADKGNAQARAKIEGWSKVEAEFAKASERADQRARQIEDAKAAMEARERAAREAAEARARDEARLKAEQEATRVRAAQQAKLAAETKARADQEAKRKVEAELETRRKAEAASVAAAAAASAKVEHAVTNPAPQTPIPSQTTDKAATPGPARGAVAAAESTTPIQAIMTRAAKNAATAPQADAKPGESESSFKANPCSAPSARFMSTCR